MNRIILRRSALVFFFVFFCSLDREFLFLFLFFFYISRRSSFMFFLLFFARKWLITYVCLIYLFFCILVFVFSVSKLRWVHSRGATEEKRSEAIDRKKRNTSIYNKNEIQPIIR